MILIWGADFTTPAWRCPILFPSKNAWTYAKILLDNLAQFAIILALFERLDMNLSEYIEIAINEPARVWEAAAPGRWAGILVTDVDHWARYGVYSIRDFQDYLDAEDAKEQRKANY
jgi:hypothetical protein